jgi:hypothetical protein
MAKPTLASRAEHSITFRIRIGSFCSRLPPAAETLSTSMARAQSTPAAKPQLDLRGWRNHRQKFSALVTASHL